jgi:hypothetical protein
MCKKLMFEQGSSDIKGDTNFSDKQWGDVTRDYVHAANKLLKESKEYFFKEARYILKKIAPHHDRDRSDTSQVKGTLRYNVLAVSQVNLEKNYLEFHLNNFQGE